MSKGLDTRLERKQHTLLHDTRRLSERLNDVLASEENVAFAMIAWGIAIFFGRQLSEFLFIGAVCFYFYARGVQKRAGLPLRMPKSSGELDPKELSPGTTKPTKADGIVYMGNDRDTGEEIWLTGGQARTHMLFMGTTGSGKALRLDEPVLTPSGFRRMGDIKVGDLVIHQSGKPTEVLGVYPQGSLPLYRISFADGRSMDVSGDHLWEVHHKHWTGKYKEGVSRAGAARPRVLTTEQIMETLSRNSGTFCIPLFSPDFSSPPSDSLPISPYLLGALLGDGSVRKKNLSFTSADKEIVAKVGADLAAYGMKLKQFNYHRSCMYVIQCADGCDPQEDEGKAVLRQRLAELGLLGCLSHQKFIPARYFEAPAVDRLELVRGLMDTDGTAGRIGSVSYSTSSPQLAEDVARLLRSLGAVVKVSTKRTSYQYRGEKREGRLSYRLNIRYGNPGELFTLPRKKDRVSTYQYSDSLRLRISSVVKLDRSEECQCIKVAASDGLFVAGEYLVTHNTEYLISLVYNSLVHGSGLIYVDGKADSSLYGKVYSMARSMGREDDVLVINFQTGAKDIYGAQPNKLSNTLNPFAVGSSGMLSELVKGLMATGEKSTWTQQAESFVEALMKPLVYLRDNHGLNLDVNVVRDYFELNKLEDLAWKDGEKYPGLLESGALDGLHAYLMNKPGYKKEKFHDQSETTHEQHGYITMQLGRTFNSLSDTYGYIMKTPLAEIDFVDVFLNRRILVVLLPALEKSPTELTNLGRIVVASIKATMAKGLGSQIEGDWKKVIDSKPTNSPSPFMCVLDEYGYYAVEGFAVVPAQARSLGFSAIFAGQDLPAFEKASKEEAKSTLGNTNTKLCGKLECMETFKYFESLGGRGFYTRLGRYETDPGAMGPTNFKADTSVSVERIDRVDLEALKGQTSGEWHLFFANTMVRVKSFFANPKPVKQLRVNHFIKVARPEPEEVEAFKASTDTFLRGVTGEGGLKSFMDVAGSVADIQDIQHAAQLFKGTDPLLSAGMILAYCAQAEQQRVGAFARLTASNFEAEDLPEEMGSAPIDFAAQMAGHSAGETAWGPESHAPWEGPAESGSAQTLAHDVDDHRLFDDETEQQRPSTARGGFDNETPLPDPAGLYDGVPADVFGGDLGAEVHRAGSSSGEGLGRSGLEEVNSETVVKSNGEVVSEPLFSSDDEFQQDFPYSSEEFETPVPADDGSMYGDGFSEEVAADPKQVPLLNAHSQDDSDLYGDAHTDVFGGDELPEAIATAENDVALDAADRPVDVDAFGEEDYEFTDPLADQGLLNREATVSGLVALERATGATEDEARMTAAIIVEDLGNATTYPISAPAKKPDLHKFIDLADQVSSLLTKSASED